MFNIKDNNETKYISTSRALVIDNLDPKLEGRIRVRSPILGETNWIPYLRGPGVLDIPRINDIVYIKCEAGDERFPVAWGNITSSRSTIEFDLTDRSDALASSDSQIKLPNTPTKNNVPDVRHTNGIFHLKPDLTSRIVPTNRGLFSPSGHLFELDDGLSTVDAFGVFNDSKLPPDHITNLTKISKGIRLTTPNGKKIHINEGGANEITHSIVIEDANGNKIEINEVTNDITLFSKNDYNVNVVNNYLEFTGKAKKETVIGASTEIVESKLIQTTTGDIVITSATTINLFANNGSMLIKASGDITLDVDGHITLNSANNTVNGGVVTNNVVNNDPITGIPLTPVGGIITGS